MQSVTTHTHTAADEEFRVVARRRGLCKAKRKMAIAKLPCHSKNRGTRLDCRHESSYYYSFSRSGRTRRCVLCVCEMLWMVWMGEDEIDGQCCAMQALYHVAIPCGHCS